MTGLTEATTPAVRLWEMLANFHNIPIVTLELFSVNSPIYTCIVITGFNQRVDIHRAQIILRGNSSNEEVKRKRLYEAYELRAWRHQSRGYVGGCPPPFNIF